MCNKRKDSLSYLTLDEVLGEDYIDANVLNRNSMFSFANHCLVVLGIMSLKHLYVKSVTGGSHLSHTA